MADGSAVPDTPAFSQRKNLSDRTLNWALDERTALIGRETCPWRHQSHARSGQETSSKPWPSQTRSGNSTTYAVLFSMYFSSLVNPGQDGWLDVL